MPNGLRAVFINHSHPDHKHVSALRMKSFAHYMSEQGNKIILLTETLSSADTTKPVPQIVNELGGHDWSQPFILACRPGHFPLLQKAREGNIGFGLRQAIIASAYLFNSGVFTDWQQGAQVCLPAIAQTFRPEIIWATFGNTDAWNIAQRLSALAQCPWVADIKDNWEAFMPTGLSRLMAARYKDAAHMTTFSASHRDEANRWFGHDKTVIYSGFERNATPAPTNEPGCFNILLTGSIYNNQCLADFIDGLASWLQSSSVAANVTFSYAGNDANVVAQHAVAIEGLCKIIIDDFIACEKLLAMQKAANLNVYIRNPGNLFQHKTVELLSAGKPIISFPGEGHEAIMIADQVGGCLLPCKTKEQVFQALQKVSSQTIAATDRDKIDAYAWHSQSVKLAKLFKHLIRDQR